MDDFQPPQSQPEPKPDISTDPSTPESTELTHNPSVVTQPPAKKSRKKLALLILLLILVAGAVVAVLVVRKPATNNQTVTASKKDISRLTYGVNGSGEVPQYPINTVGSAFSVELNAQLFEGLVGYQSDTKIVPLLAVSWNNPDDSTWVFNLRQGVKFHSGRTLTANDVKYSLDYAIQHQGDDDGASVLSVASSIKDVQVTKPDQVKITTDGPDPVLLSKLSFLGILDSKAKLGDYDAGTGPYVVKTGTTPTKDSIDLTAANSYWGGHVYTRQLDIKVYSDSDQLESDTTSRKLDLAGDFNIDQLAKIKPVKTLLVPDEGTNFIGFNVEKAGSPLQDKSARQAVADAINVPDLLKAGKLEGTQASQLVPLLLPGHNPQIKTNAYDLDKAKTLLASVKNGTQSLTFAYPSNDNLQFDELIKQLQAAGFNIKPTPIEDLNTLITNAGNGDYDMYSYGYSSSFQDGQDILSGILIGNQDYNNADINDLLDKTGSTLDQKTRISQMQKVATIVNSNELVVPLYTLNRPFALTKPYVLKSDMPGMVTGVYFWKVYQ